jgi:hypothetical protein
MMKLPEIVVYTKSDVIEASEQLERIGISVFHGEDKKRDFLDNKNVEETRGFLIQDGKGWRIQSHFLGDGISVAELVHKIDSILVKCPDIKERMELIEMMKKTKELRKIRFKEEEEKLDLEIKEIQNGINRMIL